MRSENWRCLESEKKKAHLVYVYMYVYVRVCVCACMFECVRVYVYVVCVCEYVCMCVVHCCKHAARCSSLPLMIQPISRMFTVGALKVVVVVVIVIIVIVIFFPLVLLLFSLLCVALRLSFSSLLSSHGPRTSRLLVSM